MLPVFIDDTAFGYEMNKKANENARVCVNVCYCRFSSSFGHQLACVTIDAYLAINLPLFCSVVTTLFEPYLLRGI